MSRNTFIITPELDEHILRCARAVRDVVGRVAVVDMLGRKKQRTFRNVAQARQVLAEVLRRTMWYKSDRCLHTGISSIVVDRTEWIIGVKPNGDYRSISYPMLGYIFGRDHTCFVAAKSKLAEYAGLIESAIALSAGGER